MARMDLKIALLMLALVATAFAQEEEEKAAAEGGRTPKTWECTNGIPKSLEGVCKPKCDDCAKGKSCAAFDEDCRAKLMPTVEECEAMKLGPCKNTCKNCVTDNCLSYWGLYDGLCQKA